MNPNVCEHGDHPAPAGKRFCSTACENCEDAECDHSKRDCAGLCSMNPHNCLRALEPSTTDPNRQWQCTYCGIAGSYVEVTSQPCKYVYPRCETCGLTPECARDCGSARARAIGVLIHAEALAGKVWRLLRGLL